MVMGNSIQMYLDRISDRFGVVREAEDEARAR
jgi:hypothetical protein